LGDGIWDLEETEGFESHRAELLSFRIAHEKNNAQKRACEDELRLKKLVLEATKFGLSESATARILRLENRLLALERDVNELWDKLYARTT
jgi:hypothetical protein